jgi:hypothetical protein
MTSRKLLYDPRANSSATRLDGDLEKLDLQALSTDIWNAGIVSDLDDVLETDASHLGVPVEHLDVPGRVV